VIPSDLYEPNEAGRIAGTNGKDFCLDWLIQFSVVLAAIDLFPVLTVSGNLNQPRFQMAVVRALVTRSDCAVSRHNLTILEIVADPVVSPVWNICLPTYPNRTEIRKRSKSTTTTIGIAGVKNLAGKAIMAGSDQSENSKQILGPDVLLGLKTSARCRWDWIVERHLGHQRFHCGLDASVSGVRCQMRSEKELPVEVAVHRGRPS
jgi:hypothetical protein